MKKLFIRLIAIAIVAALAWFGYRFVTQLPTRQREVASAKVRRGDVVVRAYARGELRAVRSMTLTAPNLFGTVQVTRLAPLGSFAREGDLVVEFDDQEVLSRLEEKQLELDQIEERIKKSEADLAVRNNQDEVDLLRANYSVRRAELEVKRNELLAAIDARKNDINLDEAQRRLNKLKADIESRRRQAEAELAVLRETKNKAILEMQRERQRLKGVKLLSPMSGLVAIRQARTHFFFAGTQMPDIREGDELRPGMPVADILDLSELEVVARVGELDRANLSEGQEVNIRLDALPDVKLKGKIKSLSGTATADIYSNDPEKKFDVTFEVAMRELLEALGADQQQIDRILATAERNRKSAPASSSSRLSANEGMMAMMGGGGMPGGGGGMMGGGGGMPGGGAGMAGAGEGGGQRAAGGRRRGGGNIDPSRIISRLPEEHRKEAQEALDKQLNGKKWEDLSDDEKQKAFQKLRPILSKLRQGGQGGRPAAVPGGRPEGASGPGVPDLLSLNRAGSGQFSDSQIAAADLPRPPENADQLDILLRPGLLADVEIIVEHLQDAIFIPAQAVFEKDNQPIVYVKDGRRFEERVIKPLKRSESTMIVSEGLEEGEVIALADPNAKVGEKKQAAPEGGGGNPMGGFGGAGAGGRGQ